MPPLRDHEALHETRNVVRVLDDGHDTLGEPELQPLHGVASHLQSVAVLRPYARSLEEVGEDWVRTYIAVQSYHE